LDEVAVQSTCQNTWLAAGRVVCVSRTLGTSQLPGFPFADHPNVQFNYYHNGIGTCDVEMH
jgi:hypothetical protein